MNVKKQTAKIKIQKYSNSLPKCSGLLKVLFFSQKGHNALAVCLLLKPENETGFYESQILPK